MGGRREGAIGRAFIEGKLIGLAAILSRRRLAGGFPLRGGHEKLPAERRRHEATLKSGDGFPALGIFDLVRQPAFLNLSEGHARPF